MATIDTDVNHFPSLTWNHLNINHTHLQNYIQKGALFSVSQLPSGIEMVKKTKGNFDSSDVSGTVCTTGLGKNFDEQFDAVMSELAVPSHCFHVTRSKELESIDSNSFVRLTYSAGANEHAVSDIVILAEESTDSTFILDFSSSQFDAGSLGIRIRVHAKQYATVHLVTVNMLGDNYKGFVSIGSVEDEGSRLDVVQLELGGKDVYNGSSHELLGYKACSKSKICYVVNKNHSLDVNYVVRQSGIETYSFMRTDGVVMDGASKVWRGTIDFIKGCKDAKGDEQEDVLLLNPDVVNKTLPVILCGEEDVDGRHGSSIGRLSSEILFYMQSRGIDEKTARKLIVRAKILSACKDIPDRHLVDQVQDFIEGAFVHE